MKSSETPSPSNQESHDSPAGVCVGSNARLFAATLYKRPGATVQPAVAGSITPIELSASTITCLGTYQTI